MNPDRLPWPAKMFTKEPCGWPGTPCGPSADSFRPRCRWLHISSQKFPVDVDILFEDSQPLWVMCNFFRGWVHKYCINPNHRGWPEALFRGTDLPLQLFTPSHICTAIQGPFHHLHMALNTCPRTQVLELNYLSECLAVQPCTVTDTLSFLTLSGVNSTFQLPKDVLRFNWNNTNKTLRRGEEGRCNFRSRGQGSQASASLLWTFLTTLTCPSHKAAGRTLGASRARWRCCGGKMQKALWN